MTFKYTTFTFKTVYGLAQPYIRQCLTPVADYGHATGERVLCRGAELRCMTAGHLGVSDGQIALVRSLLPVPGCGTSNHIKSDLLVIQCI